MKLKKHKDYFRELETADFSQFMDQYMLIYTELEKLLVRSHIRSKESGSHSRYNVSLHYKIRQGTITLEKLGAAFRARTIEMEKRKREGYNHE